MSVSNIQVAELSQGKVAVNKDDFYDLLDMVNTLLSQTRKEDHTSEKARNLQIRNILIGMGVRNGILGYDYLKTAINLVLDEPSMVNRITKELYPEVAKIHNTTASRVERAIRHAIEVAFTNPLGDELKDKIFGNSISYDLGKPTNTQFIAAVADYISDT